MPSIVSMVKGVSIWLGGERKLPKKMVANVKGNLVVAMSVEGNPMMVVDTKGDGNVD